MSDFQLQIPHLGQRPDWLQVSTLRAPHRPFISIQVQTQATLRFQIMTIWTNNKSCTPVQVHPSETERELDSPKEVAIAGRRSL